MLLKQVTDRLGNRNRWIAGLSVLAVAGAAWTFAPSVKSHFNAQAARPVVKGSPLNAVATTHPASPAEQARIAASFGSLPLSFEPNLGQTDPQVKFLSRNSHYNLFLTANEAVFTLPVASREKAPRGTMRAQKMRPTAQAVLRMKMLGANPAPQVAGNTQLAGHSNYLIGRDASKWVRDVDQYARVNYRGIYPGVDLTFYGQQRQLEFDFIVQPGASPNSIALGVEGAKKIATDASGDLILGSAAGDLRLHKPAAYQMRGDLRQPVDARFVIKGTEVAFVVGDYDRGRELVIDPSFLYSTYLGAGAEDDGYAIAVDSAGSAYVTGQTSSPGFPVKGALPAPNGALQGTSDAFVTKFSADGTSLAYSTYLGGTGVDSGNAITLDGLKQAYIVGSTTSTDFPTAGALIAQSTSGGGQDAFVAVLSATGNSLVYSTYIGGSGDEVGYGVAQDSQGIYVAGSTTSSDGSFPVVNSGALLGGYQGGLSDGFVTKIAIAGSFANSVFLGGSAADVATGVAVDGSHNVYVTGVTLSTNFPFFGTAPYANGHQCGTDGTCNGGKDDSFVTQIKSDFSQYNYSTYLGGSSFDDANQIVVDSSGNAYVVGISASSDFPVTGSAFQKTLGGTGASNAYVTKLDPTGSTLVYSTYIGGTGTDNGLNIALDGSKNAYITGSTTSTNFPITSGAPQTTLGGGKDAFVTELKADGTGPLLFSTYLGGSQEEDHFLAGIAVDGSNNVYVTGDTLSPDFFVTGNAFKKTYTNSCGGANPCRDAFVVKYSPLNPGFTLSVGAITPSAISRGGTGTATVTINSTTASGTVNLACNIVSTAAAPPTCSVTQPSGALTAGGSQTGGVTVTTVKTGAASLTNSALWLPLPGLALVGAGFLSDKTRKKKLLVILLGCVALAGLLLMAACGSGNGGGGGGGGGGGTTTGSYTVTVTGTITNTGSANGSANFTVQ
jgi:Beta-propeller repeat